MPEFVWSSPVSTSLREKLFSGPYASPKMARLHAVALDVNGEVWAQWAAGCTWVQDSEVAKVAANAIFADLAAAQPVVEWHRIRDFDRAEIGNMLLTVHSDGWTIRAVDIAVDELATLAEGEEGGDAGKAAAEAAYRRACGL